MGCYISALLLFKELSGFWKTNRTSIVVLFVFHIKPTFYYSVCDGLSGWEVCIHFPRKLEASDCFLGACLLCLTLTWGFVLFCVLLSVFEIWSPSWRGRNYFRGFVPGGTAVLFPSRELGPDFRLHHGNGTNLSGPWGACQLFPGVLAPCYKENLMMWRHTFACGPEPSPWTFPRVCDTSRWSATPSLPLLPGRGGLGALPVCLVEGTGKSKKDS